MLKSALLIGTAAVLVWAVPATVSANDMTIAQATSQTGYQERFDRIDANNDGVISRSEWNRHFGARSDDPQGSELRERDRTQHRVPGSHFSEHPGNVIENRPAGSPMPGGSAVMPDESTLNENQ